MGFRFIGVLIVRALERISWNARQPSSLRVSREFARRSACSHEGRRGDARPPPADKSSKAIPAGLSPFMRTCFDSGMTPPYRIVHVSDLHVWRLSWNPLHWYGKRALGMGNLLLRRARKFRLEEIPSLVQAIESDNPNHVVVSGDFTTTSLPREFESSAAGLGTLISDPARATVVPGNHDRYTRSAARKKGFEQRFGRFRPSLRPFERRASQETASPARKSPSERGSGVFRQPAARRPRAGSWPLAPSGDAGRPPGGCALPRGAEPRYAPPP